MTVQIDRNHPVRDILSALSRLAARGEVSLADVLEAFGTTSFVPMMIVPALVIASPLSGIPLLSSICGVTIALVGIQRLMRRRYVWLPDFLLRRSVTAERLTRAVRRTEWLATWIDRLTRPRFSWVLRGPLIHLPTAVSVCCGLTMPFLELIPFTSSMLAVAVVILSVGLLARDGLLILLGYAAIGGAVLGLRFIAGQVVG